MLEKSFRRRALHQPALVQKENLVAEPMRLPEVVRHEDDLRTGRVQGEDDVLDLVGGARIEARRRPVEEEDLRTPRPDARQRTPLGRGAALASRPLTPWLPSRWRPIDDAVVARAVVRRMREEGPRVQVLESAELTRLGRADA